MSFVRVTTRCAKGPIDYVIGDARLTVAKQPKNLFDILLIDAFSSDAVPVHLITREAVRMYFRKLKPAGVLAIHLSNRFLDLKPVAAALAADLGYPMRIRVAPPGPNRMLAGSVWAVLARDSIAFAPLAAWSRTVAGSPVRVWTDDYSNVLSVVKW